MSGACAAVAAAFKTPCHAGRKGCIAKQQFQSILDQALSLNYTQAARFQGLARAGTHAGHQHGLAVGQSGGQLAPTASSSPRWRRRAIFEQAKATALRGEHGEAGCLAQMTIDEQTLARGDRNIGASGRCGRDRQLSRRAQGGKRLFRVAFVEQTASVGSTALAVLHERQVNARRRANAGHHCRIGCWQPGKGRAYRWKKRHAVEQMRSSAFRLGSNGGDLPVVDARDENGVHLDQDSGATQSLQARHLSLQQ